MGGIGFWIEFKSQNNAHKSWDVDKTSEFTEEIHETIDQFLENTLTREAEVDCLEGMWGFIEVELIDNEVCFNFADYCFISSQANFHWFAIALIICWNRIDNIFKKYDFELIKEQFNFLKKEFVNEWTPLIVIKNVLYAIDTEAKELIVGDGEIFPDLSEQEKLKIAEITESKQCQCQLCEMIRAGKFPEIQVR